MCKLDQARPKPSFQVPLTLIQGDFPASLYIPPSSNALINPRGCALNSLYQGTGGSPKKPFGTRWSALDPMNPSSIRCRVPSRLPEIVTENVRKIKLYNVVISVLESRHYSILVLSV